MNFSFLVTAINAFSLKQITVSISSIQKPLPSGWLKIILCPARVIVYIIRFWIRRLSAPPWTLPKALCRRIRYQMFFDLSESACYSSLIFLVFSALLNTFDSSLFCSSLAVSSASRLALRSESDFGFCSSVSERTFRFISVKNFAVVIFCDYYASAAEAGWIWCISDFFKSSLWNWEKFQRSIFRQGAFSYWSLESLCGPLCSRFIYSDF